MTDNQVKIFYKNTPHFSLPSYQTSGSAGADIYAFLETDIYLLPGEYKAIPTGLFFEIPPGYEVQIRSRSGLALKHGISVLNSPGTIDSDYRGEIQVILINHGKENFRIQNGDRIAQMLVSPVIQVAFEKTQVLGETQRSGGGFGSTGNN